MKQPLTLWSLSLLRPHDSVWFCFLTSVVATTFLGGFSRWLWCLSLRFDWYVTEIIIESTILFISSLTSVHSPVLQTPKEDTTDSAKLCLCWRLSHDQYGSVVLFGCESEHPISYGWSRQVLCFEFRLLAMAPCMSVLTQNTLLCCHFWISLQCLVTLLCQKFMAGCCFPSSSAAWCYEGII